jgi:hypothetical protein
MATIVRGSLLASVTFGLTLLAASSSLQGAQVQGAKDPAAAAPAARAHKSVYGTLDAVDTTLNGIIMKTDEGKRVAWKFDKAVIDQLAPFKPGDRLIVIYRQRGSDKVVTAVAFPGTSEKPVYVNTSGERVQLLGGPMVDGACGRPSETSVTSTTIPVGGRAEIESACWCCAPAGESCIPGNKTGVGQAFLAHCYK